MRSMQFDQIESRTYRTFRGVGIPRYDVCDILFAENETAVLRSQTRYPGHQRGGMSAECRNGEAAAMLELYAGSCTMGMDGGVEGSKAFDLIVVIQAEAEGETFSLLHDVGGLDHDEGASPPGPFRIIADPSFSDMPIRGREIRDHG